MRRFHEPLIKPSDMKYKTKEEMYSSCKNIPKEAHLGSDFIIINKERYCSDLQQYANQEVERRRPTDSEIEKKFPRTEFSLIIAREWFHHGAKWARDFVRDEELPKSGMCPKGAVQPEKEETWEDAIKNAKPEQHRYIVAVTFRHRGFKKDTFVNLFDILSETSDNAERIAEVELIKQEEKFHFDVSILSTSAIKI
jgi:hypothetical protein